METPVTERPLPHRALEGVVSKRVDAPYHSGPSRPWVKSKNLASEAVRLEDARRSGANTSLALTSAGIRLTSSGRHPSSRRLT